MVGIVGTVAVFTFSLPSTAACLLMILGEFDLSVGSTIGFSGMMIAIFGVTIAFPIWISILITFVICIGFGAVNGYIVVKTSLPSLIATLFIPQTIECKTIIDAIHEAGEGDWLALLFGAKILGGFFQMRGDAGVIDVFQLSTREGHPVVDGIPMLIVWTFLLVMVGYVLLIRT